ncbi:MULTISPECIES: thioredoxin domain-containing protein [unclassified Leucobacter]|uniref:DsbA family protein n=1 Tax=unclassified Leucobacter TaxID=2621730 RepID=UPI00165DCA20|nr:MULTISPECIES: thioredoxin domain-containing protein [unclassified Leucobacter]MBC9927566.1 DsbA family protein [Leucobacter sp. cx-169]
MSNEANSRPTKSQRREQARADAKAARAKQQQKEKRNRRLLQGGVALAILAVIAIVAIVITTSMRPIGPGPKNMASGGAVFGADLVVQETPALKDGADIVPTKVDREKAPLDIVVYQDYMCPFCGQFEQLNGSVLENWAGNGQATVELYPLNILDPQSAGTKYSTRAANAFACVVEQQPKAAWKFNQRLMSKDVQPAEQTQGLTSDELLKQAEKAGAKLDPALVSCVKENRFGANIDKQTQRMLNGPVPNLAEGVALPTGSQDGSLQDPDKPQRITSTPTVLVNGEVAPLDTSLEEFLLKKYAEVTGNGAAADTKKSE